MLVLGDTARIAGAIASRSPRQSGYPASVSTTVNSLEMSTESSIPSAAPQGAGTMHPLAALSREEIKIVSGLIRAFWPSATEIDFKVLTLQEPPKEQVLSYLEGEHASGDAFRGNPAPDRRAWVNYYIKNTSKFHEATVNITRSRVEQNVLLGANIHAPGDGAEILAMEQIALGDEGVQAEIKKLQLPENAVVICDPWIYGSDGIGDDERMYQCFLYMRDPNNPNELDSNHYAMPLPISPVIDVQTKRVTRIDILPVGNDNTTGPLAPYKERPPNEYVPEYQQLRTDLKPLNIVQPEGASFRVTEGSGTSTIEWQKWSMRLLFNQREGMVLFDVRYDGRPLFYRVSLSDMNIPYADPRHPFHKKSAFDLGDAGAGLMANNLQLGCDCLGSIYYISGLLADDAGAPMPMPNVVCVHEQDAGIGWKHTNYRTGRAALVRSRELVLQSTITVANYEYIMAFVFNQAAEMHYEVRATGVLSTQPVDDDVADMTFGTRVHPGALAVHHQHIFSLRLDPHLDGSRANRLVCSEAHAMPLDPVRNPHGTGYEARETAVARAAGLDLAPQHNRVYKIQSAARRNAVSGRPVGYKVVAPPFQPLLAHPSSFNFRRAEFATRALWAVAFREDELYAAGRYTNQSRGGDGVAAWARRGDDILDADLVLFVQFGINHLPRVEDFPVMPCEVMRVSFKPVDFFDRNPALDVPPSVQSVNKSVGLNQPPVEAVVQGESCCAKL